MEGKLPSSSRITIRFFPFPASGSEETGITIQIAGNAQAFSGRFAARCFRQHKADGQHACARFPFVINRIILLVLRRSAAHLGPSAISFCVAHEYASSFLELPFHPAGFCFTVPG